jgi:hypothetical protein
VIVAPNGEAVGAVGEMIVVGGGSIAPTQAVSCRAGSDDWVFDIEGDLPVSPQVIAALLADPATG